MLSNFSRFFLFFCFFYHFACGWGFFAHKLINREAVFSLPAPLFNFFKYHIHILEINAVNPDKRRCAVDGEAARHYIDLDHYKEDKFLFPKRWQDAISRYGESTIQQHGIVPWYVLVMKGRLEGALRRGEVKEILRLSAEIGHYIADSNVPLHTSKNYNGQLSDQHGIHGLWESRLPELFYEKYDLFVGEAEYIEDPLNFVWEGIYRAHECIKDVFELEIEVSKNFKYDKYSYEQRGTALQRVYSYEFAEEYHKRLDGMVERQLRNSIKAVANIWYTSWVDAGSPNLEDLINLENDTESLKEEDYSEAKKIEGFRDCD